MKNKTSRVNKMKLKKAIVASLAIFILLAFTGCGTSSNSAATESPKQEDTSTSAATESPKQEDTSTTASSSSIEKNEKLNDLYQQ